MQFLLGIIGVLGFATCALGLISMKSDIQLIIAVIGFFSGFILIGLAVLIGRLSRLQN